jgi:hypothetical protein
MAGLLLYSIQIAAANVGKTTFGQANEEMVTEIRQEDEVMAAHKEQMEKLKRIEKAKTLPRINTDETDQDGKQGLPLIHTDNTDLKTGEQSLPRMDADDRGPERQNVPLINTEDTDREGVGKILTQSVGEVYANRSQTSEVHANLG